MKLTRLNVAGVASIVLFWALFACYAVEDVSEGGTAASVGADLIIWLLLASGSSIIVFAKLGPHPASYNGIAQWTLLSLYGIHVAFYFAVYYEEPKVRTLISAVFLTAGFGLFVLATIMTPAATHSIPAVFKFNQRRSYNVVRKQCGTSLYLSYFRWLWRS
jgi:hypothetical protein